MRKWAFNEDMISRSGSGIQFYAHEHHSHRPKAGEKSIVGKALVALFLAFLLILSTQIALAQIPLISSFGHWSDTKDINGNSPYCLNYSDDFSIVRNGLPQIKYEEDLDDYGCDDVTDRNLQSGFGFKGINATEITPCKEFEVGTFFHYNRPIFTKLEPENLNK